MIKKIFSNLNLLLLSLTALVLPWQSKLILRPAASNYWEIALFVGFFCSWLSLLVLALNRFNKKEVAGTSLKLLYGAAGLSVISGLVSVFLSVDPVLSFFRWTLWLAALVFFIFLRNSHQLWRRRLALILLFSLIVQAFFGLFQFFTQTSWASSYLGVAYHSAADLGASVIETSDGRWLRAYGASDHPNIFGGLMSLAAIGSLYFFLQESRRYWRLVFLGFYIIFLTAVFTSFSRAAMLALFVGLIILFWERRFWIKENLRLFTALALLSVLVFGIFAQSYRPLLLARGQINNRLEKISLAERSELNTQAWRDFKLSPWFGVGLGASTLFNWQIDKNANQVRPAWYYQPAHNYWLLAAAEGGIFFISAVVFLWFLAYQKSRKHRLLGLFFAFFVLTLFDHWLFSLPLSALWIFFLLALIW